MCIRDSVNSEEAYQNLVRFLFGDVRVDVWAAIWAIQLPACLLYTSDAADERSSVDLGGRRIIKKKTHADTAATNVRDKHSIQRRTEHT